MTPSSTPDGQILDPDHPDQISGKNLDQKKIIFWVYIAFGMSMDTLGPENQCQMANLWIQIIQIKTSGKKNLDHKKLNFGRIKLKRCL